MRPLTQRQPRSGAVRSWLGPAAVIGSLLLGAAAAQLKGDKSTERISVSSTGAQSNGDSLSPAMSADGRIIAFQSTADNLVPGDTNGVEDVFVRDRLTGTTELVSLSSRESGAAGNRDSGHPAISADGRYVAFASGAENLVPEDTNHRSNVFVRDRLLGTTELVSVTTEGVPGSNDSQDPAISGDGRFVAFDSIAQNLVQGNSSLRGVFVRDQVARTTERVDLSSAGQPADNDSVNPAMSADGRYIAFESRARNLIPGDTNGDWDVFVRDRVAGTTECVSLAADGTTGRSGSENPAISRDGRYVAFVSDADNLVPGDANSLPDVFVRDRLTARTERVSVVSGSTPEDGRRFFYSQPAISLDGRTVAFAFFSPIAGDSQARWQIFLRDRMQRVTEPISLSTDATPGNGESRFPAISGDGRLVAFASAADNLVPGDTNSRRDIFVRDRAARAADLVVEPQTLVFDRIQVGAKQTLSLILRNVSTQTVDGTVKPAAEPFSVLDAGDFSLAAGASRTITIQFAPKALGLFQGTLVITRRDGATAVSVLLAGEGIGGSTGKLMLIPRAEQGLTLLPTVREIVYGECTSASLVLRNTGMGPLSGSVGSLRNPFTVVEGGGEFELAPGESRTVKVRFCPTVGSLPQRYEATLEITSSVPGATRVPVPLRVQLP